MFTFESVVSEKTSDNQLLDRVAKILFEFDKEIDFPIPPSPIVVLKERIITNPYDQDYICTYVLLRDNNKDIGLSHVWKSKGKLNKNIGIVHLYIRPTFRNKGYMKKLLKKSLEFLPSNVTRFSIRIRVDNDYKHYTNNRTLVERIESGKFNAKLTFSSARTTSYIKEFNLDLVQKKVSELNSNANKKGYSIYFMDNVVFTNTPFSKKEFVEIVNEIENDIPYEDRDLDEIKKSIEDFDEIYKLMDFETKTPFIFVALKDGKPVGFTETHVSDYRPEIADQYDTGVIRSHRGNKLGLTLKYNMLHQLITDPRSKEVKYWTTFTAGSNDQMNAINDELGFRKSAEFKMYELDRSLVEKYLQDKT